MLRMSSIRFALSAHPLSFPRCCLLPLLGVAPLSRWLYVPSAVKTEIQRHPDKITAFIAGPFGESETHSWCGSAECGRAYGNKSHQREGALPTIKRPAAGSVDALVRCAFSTLLLTCLLVAYSSFSGAWQKTLPTSLSLNSSLLASHRKLKLGPSAQLVNTRLELLGEKAARQTKGRPGPILAELNRAMIGADVGFKGYVRVRGVGYRFHVDQADPKLPKAESMPHLHVSAGLSHPLIVPLNPEFQTALTRKFRMLRLRSKGLNTLTQTLSSLRAMRPPDVYKGKGIRYRKDNVAKKVGKKKKV